jgi:hypothetical protein
MENTLLLHDYAGNIHLFSALVKRIENKMICKIQRGYRKVGRFPE